jgi:hypothetical protein
MKVTSIKWNPNGNVLAIAGSNEGKGVI